jgi:hypothetical protein
VSGDPGVVVEGALTLYFLGAIFWSLSRGILSALPFLCLFAAGFGAMTAFQVFDAIRRRAERWRPGEAAEDQLRS